MSVTKETDTTAESKSIYSWTDNKGTKQEIILHYKVYYNGGREITATVGEHDLGEVKLIDGYHGTHLYPCVLIYGFDGENAMPSSPDTQVVVMLDHDDFLEIESWFQ